MISKRIGLELTILAEPDDPNLRHYFDLFDALLCRDYEPLKAIKVEKVNGTAIRQSPFREALVSYGFEEDFKAYTYRGRLHS